MVGTDSAPCSGYADRAQIAAGVTYGMLEIKLVLFVPTACVVR